jgi:hypothetical protein
MNATKEPTSHTPGPLIDNHSHVDDSRGVPLFRTTRTFDDLNPLDFRLAAAAPDLLAACQLALKRIVQLDPDFYEDSPTYNALRAAVAKATATDEQLERIEVSREPME